MPKFSFEDVEENYPDYSKCLKSWDSDECKLFKRANLKYDEIIENGKQIILDAFEKHHGCRPKLLPIPQLFTPLKTEGEFGEFEDRAVAFNQNSVNNIFFWPNLILPKQSIGLFNNYIENNLRPIGIKTYYANGDFAHKLLGGIHCATNVSYACKK